MNFTLTAMKAEHMGDNFLFFGVNYILNIIIEIRALS